MRTTTNKYLATGYIASFIYFGVGHFIHLPDFIAGLCVGISLAAYSIGLYAIHHDVSKLHNFKKRLFRKLS